MFFYWWKGSVRFACFKILLVNLVNILNERLHILIDCSQLSITYYNVLFGSFTRDRHARRIYLRTFAVDENRKASDTAEYIELFGSFTRDRHARRRIYRRTFGE